LTELTTLRDQLKSGLSATAQGQGDEAKATGPELAERIKALKAANTIDAAPQRVQQKHSTAEEPVTARIRRRKEAASASLASDLPIGSDAAASPTGTVLPPASTAQPTPGNVAPSETPSHHTGPAAGSSIKPKMTFRERVARSRRRNEGPEISL
jgi:hypothetical protein